MDYLIQQCLVANVQIPLWKVHRKKYWLNQPSHHPEKQPVHLQKNYQHHNKQKQNAIYYFECLLSLKFGMLSHSFLKTVQGYFP